MKADCHRSQIDTLKSFKEAGNRWTCDPTYEKQFLFWKSLTSSQSIFKGQVDSALEIGKTTFTNNVDVENVFDSVLNFDITFRWYSNPT